MSFYIRTDWLITKVFSIDDHIIIFDYAFWKIIFSSKKSFRIIISIWINSKSLFTPTKFDSRKFISSFVVFLLSLFILYSFQKTDPSNPLLRRFDSFWLSLADKVTTGTYIFVSLMVKIILLTLASSLILFLLPDADKMQYLV